MTHQPIRKIRLRRDTPEDWLLYNPVLDEGEPGYEKGTGKMKVGDGVHRWIDLDYFIPEDEDAPPGSTDAAVAAHIDDPTPHPVYDDGPSLELLYQNAKV